MRKIAWGLAILLLSIQFIQLCMYIGLFIYSASFLFGHPRLEYRDNGAHAEFYPVLMYGFGFRYDYDKHGYIGHCYLTTPNHDWRIR